MLSNRVLRDPKQRQIFKSSELYELFTLGQFNIAKCPTLLASIHHVIIAAGENMNGETETTLIFPGSRSYIPRADV